MCCSRQLNGFASKVPALIAHTGNHPARQTSKTCHKSSRLIGNSSVSTHTTSIDRIRIATPCPVSWEQMSGDNRVRFCDQCQLKVYNITALSRVEAESLIASSEGRLCVRLYRRADGTILTNDCPVGLRALRMRISKRAAAVMAVLAGLAGAGFGQQSTPKDGKTACLPQVRITRTDGTAAKTEHSLSGTVVDQSGGAFLERLLQ